MNSKYFSGHYIGWRATRISYILEYFQPSFFYGKKILEVGCGYGDIGSVFLNLGAKVTCSDGISEYIDIVSRRFPNIDTVVCDLDNNWPDGNFDITIHMGVLYHLYDYKQALRNACSNSKILILETEVCDSDDPEYFINVEESGYDQAKNKIGSRPSPASIEKILEECNMSYIRIVDKKLNFAEHTYDWEIKNTKTFDHGLRRFWLAQSNL